MLPFNPYGYPPPYGFPPAYPYMYPPEDEREEPQNAIVRLGNSRIHGPRFFGTRTSSVSGIDQTVVSNILDRLESIEAKLGNGGASSTEASLIEREKALKKMEEELSRKTDHLDNKARALQALSQELSSQAMMLDSLAKNGPKGGMNAEAEALLKSQEAAIKEWQTIWTVINEVFSKFYSICMMLIPTLPESKFDQQDPMTIISAMQSLIKAFASCVLPKETLSKMDQVEECDEDDPDKLD